MRIGERRRAPKVRLWRAQRLSYLLFPKKHGDRLLLIVDVNVDLIGWWKQWLKLVFQHQAEIIKAGVVFTHQRSCSRYRSIKELKRGDCRLSKNKPLTNHYD